MTDRFTTAAELKRILGKSGVRYYCRCGAESPLMRSPRLMDAPGWTVQYEVVCLKPKEVADGKPKPKAATAKTSTAEVFLCEKCNPRKAKR